MSWACRRASGLGAPGSRCRAQRLQGAPCDIYLYIYIYAYIYMFYIHMHIIYLCIWALGGLLHTDFGLYACSAMVLRAFGILKARVWRSRVSSNCGYDWGNHG